LGTLLLPRPTKWGEGWGEGEIRIGDVIAPSPRKTGRGLG